MAERPEPDRAQLAREFRDALLKIIHLQRTEIKVLTARLAARDQRVASLMRQLGEAGIQVEPDIW